MGWDGRAPGDGGGGGGAQGLFGSGVDQSGTNANAGGDSTSATGDNSFAIGRNATASGSRSHAEGQGTAASGDQAHSEGYNTIASGDSSHAEGNATTASHPGAHSEGISTASSNNGAHAEGDTTTASGYASHSQGQGAKAFRYAEDAAATFSGSRVLQHSEICIAHNAGSNDVNVGTFTSPLVIPVHDGYFDATLTLYSNNMADRWDITIRGSNSAVGFSGRGSGTVTIAASAGGGSTSYGSSTVTWAIAGTSSGTIEVTPSASISGRWARLEITELHAL